MNSLNMKLMSETNNLKVLSDDELLVLLQSDLSESQFTAKMIGDELFLRLGEKENQAIERFIQKTLSDLCDERQGNFFFHLEPVLSASMVGTIGYFTCQYILNYWPVQLTIGMGCGLIWNYYSIQSWKQNKKQVCSEFMTDLDSLYKAQQGKNLVENMISKI